jgi:hypothetical protein
MRSWLWIVAPILHLIALALYLDWTQIVTNPPVADTDFATHWAETWSVSYFLDDWRLWGYDPSFMAGYPSGALYDIDNKLIEVASWLLSRTPLSLAQSYNVVLVCLIVLAPLAVYPAARWLGLGQGDALAAQLAALGLWYVDPALQWSWQGGTFAFLVAVYIALLVVAAAARLTTAAAPAGVAPWLVWFVAGPLLFWLHAFAFALLLVPLVTLTVLRWRGLSRRQRLAIELWPPLVVLVNLPWLITALRYLDTLTRSDQFLQGGLAALKADVLGLGYIDGASRPGLLGLRWLVLLVGGVGLWRLCGVRPLRGTFPRSVASRISVGARFIAPGWRSEAPGSGAGAMNRAPTADATALRAVAAGAWFALVVAYGAIYLPGGGDLQPYRYVQLAAVWSTLGIGAGLRFVALPLARLGSQRSGAVARAVVALAVVAAAATWIGMSAWPSRPPALGGPAYHRWRGPSDEIQALCSSLRVETDAGGRVLVDDWRVGALLPWCAGAEVIGGPFLHFSMDYGYANATMWAYLEIAYRDYAPDAFRMALARYDVRWLLIHDWQAPGWYTLADWLGEHPGEAEIVASSGRYTLYRIVDPEAPAAIHVTATPGTIGVTDAPPGTEIVLPYHWLADLRVESGSARIRPVVVGDDPVSFIVLTAPEGGDARICVHTPCD